MTQIKNNINTYADITAYNADTNKDYPNVSYIQGDEVKWNKYDPDHIVCVYNVTSTESATKLLNANTSITYQIIDGVQQQSIQMNYTFDTLGEHIVKYKMNVTYINGQTLFYMCPNLVSVVIPETITSIEGALFYSCSNLTNVVLPKTLTFLGERVFEYCSKLTTISIPNGVTEIEKCFGNSGLTYIDLPNSVTTLEGTFDTAQSLKRVNSNVDGECNIPDGVTTIGGSTFFQCSITSINIPDSVTTIGTPTAFAGNYNKLKRITIGSGITSIGNQATTNSTGIQSITVKATTPPAISELTWQSTTCPIYVPAESVEAYKTTGNWVTYADRIQAIPSE